jgi:hypothetical protein
MNEKETKRYEEAKNKDFKRDNQIPEPIYDDFTKPEGQVKAAGPRDRKEVPIA